MDYQRKLIVGAFLGAQFQAPTKQICEDMLGFSHWDIETRTLYDQGGP
jgi:hypothetical protein